MKKTPVLHPYFFAVYAVLGVYAESPQELPVQWVIRPLIILVGITGLIYLAFKKWTEDSQRAGFLTSLILAWIFIGHLHNLLVSQFSASFSLFQDLMLIIGWGVLLVLLGSNQVWKRIKIPELVTNFLNVTSWVVILVPLYFVAVFTTQEIKQSKATPPGSTSQPEIKLSSSLGQPDIYIIILDAYGREDFLADTFNFDNGEFVEFLNDRGFYVAGKSRTNYPQTQLSLSTLLNMEYPNDWTGGLEETNNRSPLTGSIVNSQVQQALESIGYQIINIPNSTLIGDLEDSDVYLSPFKVKINQFEGLILATTFMDTFAQRWNLGINIPGYGTQRRTTQYQLDALKDVSKQPSPKFVFVHILAPHPPFIFDKDGNEVQPNAVYTLGDGGGFPGTRAEYEQGYKEQITYINKQMEEVIDSILNNSSEEPIIVIQGDHGPGSRFDMLALENVDCLWERFSILNTYYFPGQKYDSLYSTITPVNSFRIIFNQYFGTELQLLEDNSYYASYGSPYIYQDVTATIPSSCQTP